MYSSLTAGHFDGAPLHKFDWLGQSLAIVTGIASPEQARRIVARYPHGPMGAPVIYPQQQDMPVYHNRAIWPFVTAYGLKAAVLAQNVSVADAAYDTLIRGAALNLSNMENLEWLSGQPLLLDEQHPALIGPVINSKRQLWSVGAYLGMVTGQVFGVSADAAGITVKPFITARLRRGVFGTSNVIALQGLQLRGKRIGVRIDLPPAAGGDGYYQVEARRIAWDALQDGAVIALRLGRLVRGDQAMRRVKADPYAQTDAVFGPREPALTLAPGPRLVIGAARGDRPTRYNLYRDGKLAARGLPAGEWTGTPAAAACYAAEAQFTGSGNRSHHSAPVCTGAATQFDAGMLRNEQNSGGVVRIGRAGQYAVQLRYRNTANQVNLGISGAVKWLVLRDDDGRAVAQGVVQLPHTLPGQGAYSTPLNAALAAGDYRMTLTDFYNMSYLQANSSFSAAGGAAGPSNTFDLDGVRFMQVK